MNQESTDFAAHRFTPRQSRGPEHSCAVEHYRPPHESRVYRFLRALVCLAAGIGIGAMIARGA